MGTALTDAEIVQRIKVGKTGAMPAFGSTFSAAELQAIVLYIRGLREDGAAK
jgi:mono/diheme cytochrome c family protein